VVKLFVTAVLRKRSIVSHVGHGMNTVMLGNP